MDKKMVSIIIPVYNGEKYIAHCIQSILRQSYKNFEIIVVNDGSRDGTPSLVNSLALENPCIRLINQENRGVSAARNRGIEAADGEFITMVDSDDDLPKDALESLVTCMSVDVDLVIGSHYEVRLKKKRQEKPDLKIRHGDIGEYFRKLDSMIWTPWAKLFRKQVIDSNRIVYDESISYGEDHLFNLRYLQAMKGAAVSTGEYVYNYHTIRSGLCSKYYPNMDALQRYVLDYVLVCISFFVSDQCKLKSLRAVYVGNYFRGLCDYYLSWCPFEEAVKQISKCASAWSDLLTREVIEITFKPNESRQLTQGLIDSFAIQYRKDNFKRTRWRGAKRRIRQLFERLNSLVG